MLAFQQGRDVQKHATISEEKNKRSLVTNCSCDTENSFSPEGTSPTALVQVTVKKKTVAISAGEKHLLGKTQVEC